MCSEKRVARAAALLLVGLLATACSTTPDKDDPSVAYREADSVKSLEVPPDLTRPVEDGSTSVPKSDATGAGDKLLPEFEGVRFVRVGASSWLELPSMKPEDVWPRISGFLRSQGLTVSSSEPQLGIVKTGWAERYDSPESGGISGFISGIFSSVSSDTVKDRYQIRLERMENGTGTRVFVTQWSAQEVATSSGPEAAGDFAWAQRHGDPAIEAEMTRRLLVYLGATESRAQGVTAGAGSAARLGGDVTYRVNGVGAASISVDDRNYARVFARIGDAVATVGAEVRNADRERGIYKLAWLPPPDVVEQDQGLLDIFGSDKREPRTVWLRLRPVGHGVRIVAADALSASSSSISDSEELAQKSGPVQRALLQRLTAAMGGTIDKSTPADQPEKEDRFHDTDPLGPSGPS